MVKAAQYLISHEHIMREMNHTYISLIPKMEGRLGWNNFFLIALCNVMMKILTKILATRLWTVLDKLVSPSKADFIPNWSVTENTILNHEIMHYMNGKKDKHACRALKIDMAKAYDRVDWDALKAIMKFHGFSPHFVNLVNECISTSSFSVLTEGSSYGVFLASRGIR